jgi:tetratricopeptide (TPR) repeat protein
MLGETERARHLAEDLLQKAEGSMSNPWRAGLARWSLARALRLGGDPKAAESVADEGLANARAHPRLEFLPDLIAEAGAIKLELGKYDEALRLLDEATAPLLSKPNRPLRRPFDSEYFVLRGRTLVQMQRIDEARHAFQRAYEYWPSVDPDHPVAAEAAWWYGYSLIATGEVARGKAMVADARPRLAASFLPHLRPLATAPAPIVLPADNVPKAKAQVTAH